MHIEERKEALCEKQFALYTCYLNGELNRSQYLRLIKPLDIEIDALEMTIYYRYLQKNNIRRPLDEIKNTKRDEENTRTIEGT